MARSIDVSLLPIDAPVQDVARLLRARVSRVTRVPKHAFPTEQVYGYTDHAALRLITCSGTYLEKRHRYLENVVVYARLDGRPTDCHGSWPTAHGSMRRRTGRAVT